MSTNTVHPTTEAFQPTHLPQPEVVPVVDHEAAVIQARAERVAAEQEFESALQASRDLGRVRETEVYETGFDNAQSHFHSIFSPEAAKSETLLNASRKAGERAVDQYRRELASYADQPYPGRDVALRTGKVATISGNSPIKHIEDDGTVHVGEIAEDTVVEEKPSHNVLERDKPFTAAEALSALQGILGVDPREIVSGSLFLETFQDLDLALSAITSKILTRSNPRYGNGASDVISSWQADDGYKYSFNVSYLSGALSMGKVDKIKQAMRKGERPVSYRLSREREQDDYYERASFNLYVPNEEDEGGSIEVKYLTKDPRQDSTEGDLFKRTPNPTVETVDVNLSAHNITNHLPESFQILTAGLHQSVQALVDRYQSVQTKR